MFSALPASKVVISLSGGMDSTSLLLNALARDCDIYGISFNYGQKHNLELDRLNANLTYLKENGFDITHTVIDLSILGTLYNSALTDPNWKVPEGHYEQENMKQTVVPNRNAIFASIAYGYALSLATRNDQQVSIALGVHAGDHAIYPDCRPEFYKAIHKAFVIGNWDSEKVNLYLPYLEGDKLAILRDAQESIEKLKLDFNTVFRNTSTSYDTDDQGRASGKTGSDVERILAFYALGTPDPVAYTETWEVVLKNALNLENVVSE